MELCPDLYYKNIINNELFQSITRGNVWYSIDGKANSTQVPGNFLDNSTSLIDGNHNITIFAIDNAGNTNSTKVNFTIDTILPFVNISSPSNGYSTTSSTITITGTTELTASVSINENIATVNNTSGVYVTTIPLNVGSNTVSVTANDMAGNPNTTSINVVRESTPTPPSSGGSSGGGTSGEEYENIEVKDVVREQIVIDTDVTYEFKEETNAIDTIVFTALKNSGEISATIEVLKERSALVKNDPPGKVYQNMNIWVGKSGFATSNNIKDVKVGFKVEKSWIKENDIVVSTIRLCRNHDDVWNPLPTKQSGEDDTYIYFEAKTPGFSPFSITGSTEEEVVAQDSAAGGISSDVPNVGADVVDGDEEVEDDGGVSMAWGVVGAVLVLLIGGAYWIYGVKK